MTRKILVLMWLCAMFAVQSCTSDQEPSFSEMQESDVTISHMVVKFEDHIYETDVMAQGDSITYLNEEFAEVYRSKIVTNPNIAAVTCTDSLGVNYLEYFSTEKELLDNYDFVQLENKSENCSNISRSSVIDMLPPYNASPIIGHATLFDDKGFKDTELHVYAATDWGTAIGKLGNVGFNDKASSIKVGNLLNPEIYYTIKSYDLDKEETTQIKYRGDRLRPVLKCFHNSNFSGAVLYCIPSPSGSTVVHEDNNLKNIGWNDRISSLGWVLISDFSLFQGTNPVIPTHPDC